MLRYLLGTKFNQLFLSHNASSGGLIAEERGIIGIRFVETALKERLLELLEFVKAKKSMLKELEKMDQGGDLNLHYGFKIVGVKEPASEEGEDSYFALVSNENGQVAHQHLPVDLLLCIGGANDKLRDKLIGLLCVLADSGIV
jgi:hypothetical protein